MSPGNSPPEKVNADNPWLGLSPFTEELRDFFFGRDDEIAEVFERVARASSVILFGQSGLGKSSLLQAGLFPRLRVAEFLPVYIRLDHTAEAPPFATQIKAALVKAIQSAPQLGTALLPEEDTNLWEYLHRRTPALRNQSGTIVRPVLVFDQFEEIFTLGSNETGRAQSRAFIRELAELAENRPPADVIAHVGQAAEPSANIAFESQNYRILISLREDYLPHLEALRNRMPSIMENRVRLTRMNGLQAMQAVLKPGGKLVSALVARRIVRFIAGQRREKRIGFEDDTFAPSERHLVELEIDPALLSLVCRELNNRRRTLGHSEVTLDLLTGSSDAILRDFYERCLADQPRGVRKFIEEDLLTESGFRENVALERANRTLERHGVSPMVIPKLVNRRLLRVEERYGTERVELTHDVLTGVVRATREARQRRRIRLWKQSAALLAAALVVAGGALYLMRLRPPKTLIVHTVGSAPLLDDAGGRRPSDFAELDLDLFAAMDGGIRLSPDEIKGRNTWLLWTGGNELFWDRVARETHGVVDLLKALDSRERSSRFKEMGVINEPGLKGADKPERFGLWLDEPVEPVNAKVDPAIYGRPTGVIGLRLFPNPDFSGDAIKNWNAERFYNDPAYASDPALVRPYRVGVSCALCHTGFHPLFPPVDLENPKWENLASTIGNQYLQEGRVFAPGAQSGSFFWEMLASQPPGTADMSRVVSDSINNPVAIPPALGGAARWQVVQEEQVAGSTLLFFGITADRIKSSRFAAGGTDSVGLPAANLRFYVGMGTYSQYWLTLHKPFTSAIPQEPFDVSVAQKNSVYWLATVERLPSISRLLRRIPPLRLEDSPEGKQYLTSDPEILTRGKIVFAENCARCHSSKGPPLGTDERAWFVQEVVKPDFRENNYFSDDLRYPVTQIGTNAAATFGRNHSRGHIWENFSSLTFKELPSVGTIHVWNPYTEKEEDFAVEGGGPGYYRTPSLISLWSSAPFLHNNSLGKFTGDPSIAGRMDAFNDAVSKLLWPERRLGKESIWRTTRESQLSISGDQIPEQLRTLLKPHIDADNTLRLGFIPAGIPVNLLANVDLQRHPQDLAELWVRMKQALMERKLKNQDPADAKEAFMRDIAPILWKASASPDLVEDRGHYFGSELPDADKLALIEFLKTL